MKRVTVLMPVYNCGAYVQEAIHSILNQSFCDFDLLIINDASTDASQHLINSIKDPRIRLIKNEQNIQLVRTLNKGLALIETEYMIRMDGDDISHPDRIKKLVEFMDSHSEIGVCGSFIQTFGNDNTIWKYDETDAEIRPCIFYKSLVGHASAIFRMSVFQKYTIRYSEKFLHIEDRELWLQLFDKVKFHNLQEVLYSYRILDHNITVVNKGTLQKRVTDFYLHLFAQLKFNVSSEILRMHLGYYDLSLAKPNEINLYYQWLNDLEQDAVIRLGCDEQAMNRHKNILWERLLPRVIKSKNFSLMKAYNRKCKSKKMKNWYHFLKVKF